MERSMVFPNDNPPPRKASNIRRVNSTTGWAIVGAVAALLFGLLLFTTGRDTHHPKSGENSPNPVTQPQPQK
jgi:hypothetical protein